ncbi:hypothetical protein MferCBS31731_007096 [Microsporum ferrugineum]
MATTPAIECLPFELIDSILSFVPVVDYYSLKLAGSRYLTGAVRSRTSLFSRDDYFKLLRQQDQHEVESPEGRARSVLAITIERGNQLVVRQHLERYKDAKDSSSERRSGRFACALHLAALYGSIDILKLLIGRVNYRCRRTGSTALHFAARGGSIEAARLLIENGADVNAITFEEKTPVALALGCEHDELAQYLEGQGGWICAADALRHHPSRKLADLVWRCTDEPAAIEKPELEPTQDGRPRAFCAFFNYLSATQDSKEYQQSTALCDAISFEVGEVISSIVDDGFHVDAICYATHDTLLHLAVKSKSEPMVELLLRHGADPARTQPRWATPFHLAVGKAEHSMIEIFVRSGISVNLADEEGNTALHSRNIKRDSYIRTLVDKLGANVNAKNHRGETPIYTAVNWEYVDAAERLLVGGADVNTQDNDMRTPLMRSCEERCPEMIRLLLKHGSDITLLNSNGHNAMEIANISGITTILEHSDNAQLKAKRMTLDLIRQTRMDEDP